MSRILQLVARLLRAVRDVYVEIQHHADDDEWLRWQW